MTEYGDKLETLYDKYLEYVEKVAQEAFKEVVVPICNSRNWKFISGMGTWWLGPFDGHGDANARSQYPEDHPGDEEFEAVWNVLEECILGMNQLLGSYMPDYDPRQERIENDADN